jgi:hypothetical protein
MEEKMKNIISLMIAVVLLFSCSIPAFASDSEAKNTTNIVPNKVLNELNKITNKVDRDKIEQFLFTPLYSESFVDDKVPANENSNIERIQYLNKFSGSELDKQIASQLRNTIDSKIQSPYVCFSDEAVSLAKQYCPEKLAELISKTVPEKILIEPAMAALSFANCSYYRTIYFQEVNGFNVIMWKMSISIDWRTDSNGNINYCKVPKKSFTANPFAGVYFNRWGTESIAKYPGYATIHERALFNYVDAPHTADIDAHVEWDGKLYYTNSWR